MYLYCMQVERLIDTKDLNKEYAGITGVPEFVKASVEFALTKDNQVVKNNHVSVCVRVVVMKLSFIGIHSTVRVPAVCHLCLLRAVIPKPVFNRCTYSLLCSMQLLRPSLVLEPFVWEQCS